VEIYLATDDSMPLALCVLDTKGYKHTFRMCNIYCFSTATMVVRTRLNVSLHIHCPSLLLFNRAACYEMMACDFLGTNYAKKFVLESVLVGLYKCKKSYEFTSRGNCIYITYFRLSQNSY